MDRRVEIVELRVDVAFVDGSQTAIECTSASEADTFILPVIRDDAATIASLPAKHLDIEAEVERDSSGRISSGRLLALYRIDESPGAAAAALSAAASAWEDVQDIEGELGR